MIAVCSGVGLALDAEELLLEGAAVVEGEDVELLVVSEVHGREYSRGALAVAQAAGPALGGGP